MTAYRQGPTQCRWYQADANTDESILPRGIYYESSPRVTLHARREYRRCIPCGDGEKDGRNQQRSHRSETQETRDRSHMRGRRWRHGQESVFGPGYRVVPAARAALVLTMDRPH